MFGSVNLLDTVKEYAPNHHCSQFGPMDLVGVVAISGVMTSFACEDDEFRIVDPYVGQWIADKAGDRFGFIGDARFLAGTACALIAAYKGDARDGMVGKVCHDLAAASYTSLVATEVCRFMTEKEAAEGAQNIHLLGVDEDLLDDDLLDDAMGLEEYADAGSMNFAYGW